MMTEEKSCMLELRDVVFRYNPHGKRNILDHLSLSISDKRITVITGRSGCGKSTLAAVSAGLYPENGGFLEGGGILLYGRPVADMNPQERAKYLTVMFQNPDLQFCMRTLRKEMEFCLENLCIPASEMDQMIQEAAENLGITELLDKPLSVLSGGEKQKANLACLFLIKSNCIFLDEPFANVDESSALDLIKQIEMMHDAGFSFVVIDHRLDYWLPVADEIIVLGSGGQVMRRDINKKNLEAHNDFLHDMGLLFDVLIRKDPNSQIGPESAGKTLNFDENALTEDDDTRDCAVRFSNVTIRTENTKWNRKEMGEILLEEADAVFENGKMTAILGPSGSGKTTALLSILKQHSFSGIIEVEGENLAHCRRKELYRKIGIVFQNPANQFISQNVQEEIELSIRQWNRNIAKEQCSKKAIELLAEFGLDSYRRYSPYMLSQGQQRRLAVLSVLAGGQRILLLDEPTYGQDHLSTVAIMDSVADKVEREELTVIFITHDRKLALEYADCIYKLENRKLIKMTDAPGV